MTPVGARRPPPFVHTVLYGLLLLLCVGMTGCDEQTLGPQAEGDIKGAVRSASSGSPVADATVSTSPPTQSVSTEEDGTFALSGVEAGNYTVTAEKRGFENKTVSVQVDRGETSQAAIRLSVDEDERASADSLTARVEDFFTDAVNRDDAGADSLFVAAEYSVVNDGEVRITAYEVYFEVRTDDGGTYTHEASGDTLAVDERDLRDFRVYTRQAKATDVEVTGAFTETERR